jgi:biopolymer transport protein TolQ
MTTELSTLLQVVTEASIPVQAVMLILLLVSLTSWNSIFYKRTVLGRARRAADRFEEQFWAAKDLVSLYQRIDAGRHRPTGLERIFLAGFKEFAHLRGQGGSDPRAALEQSQRAMRIAVNREVDTLEAQLPFLATVASTSPYIGLFGTVWGIMQSFHSLGNVPQASLSVVAPGIAEALLATAMGLFAAIPAVIAYNRYVHQVERVTNRYDTFVEEFSNILQRQVRAQARRNPSQPLKASAPVSAGQA